MNDHTPNRRARRTARVAAVAVGAALVAGLSPSAGAQTSAGQGAYRANRAASPDHSPSRVS